MWNLTKRIFHFISTVLFYSVIVIVGIVIIMVGLNYYDQMQARNSGINRAPLFGSFIIITDSMVPSINPGDAVVTMRVEPEELTKKDVITFVSNEHNGVTVTHRIVGIFDNKNGDYAFRTKGDHNNVEDDELVTYDRFIGKVIFVIPYIGYLQQFITQGSGWFIFIILPCVWIIISDIIKVIKKSNDSNGVQDEKTKGNAVENKESSKKTSAKNKKD